MRKIDFKDEMLLGFFFFIKKNKKLVSGLISGDSSNLYSLKKSRELLRAPAARKRNLRSHKKSNT